MSAHSPEPGQLPSVTVAIRTRNEIRTIGRVLTLLKAQTLSRFEILVVDNRSTDGTREVAERDADRVIDIRDFTHAHSTSRAVTAARGDFVYLTNGHTFPEHADMLETAARVMAADPGIAGLYGRCRPHRDPSMANAYEWLIAAAGDLTWPRRFRIEQRFRPGMLQTQSAMLRRGVAMEVPFEDFGAGGGEDALFAMEVLHRGHQVGYHPILDVRHSHGGPIAAAVRRFRGYGRMIAHARAEAARRGIPPAICGLHGV